MNVNQDGFLEKIFKPLLDPTTPQTWDVHFCLDARFRAMKSKDPSSKIGAVIITEDYTPVSHGFNGIPRKVRDDLPERNDRDLYKYSFYEHAERNAIYNAAREGRSCKGTVMYVTDLPCCPCARAISQTGIKKVIVDSITFENKDFIERWMEDIKHAQTIFSESGVDVNVFDMETKRRYSLSKYITL